MSEERQCPIGDDADDIGHGVRVVPIQQQGQIVGYMEAHRRPDDGEWCSGWVQIESDFAVREAPVWIQESASPLTLSPSILCRRCGNHGWIKEGRWVPA